MSLEDELLTILSAKRVSQLKHLARRRRAEELPGNWISQFAQAQRLFERRSEQERNQLLVREQQKWETMLPLGLDPYIELPTDV